jgi:hypothetical protein
MPRPTRKPKRFNSSTTKNNSTDAPVISTPLHSKQSTTNPPPLASPELSPIQRENEFTIYDDENKSIIPEQDHFGFGRVKGVKKTFVPIQIDSDDADDDFNDENHADDVSVKDEDDDEDIYGEPYVPPATTEAKGPSKNDDSSPLRPTPKKKPISKLRTSQLLPLLPSRRKRQPPRPQKKQSSHDCSDAEPDVPVKSKSVKKRRVADKENDEPEGEIDSEEERKIEERRKIVKKKFAEVDNWEMAFETVDLSFSSQ